MGWGYLSMTHSEETEYFQGIASLFTHTMHYNKKLQDMMTIQHIFTEA